MRTSNPQRRADDRPRVGLVAGVFACAVSAFIAGRLTAPTVVAALSEAHATPVPRALPEGIEKFHDASEDVTCWMLHQYRYDGPISLACLPDQWLASARAQEAPQ